MSDETPPPVPEPQQIIEMESIKPKRGMPLGVLLLLIAGAAVTVNLVDAFGLFKPAALRPGQHSLLGCKVNLHRIGIGIQIYREDNGRLTPPNVKILVKCKPILPDHLQCPSSANGGSNRVDYIFVTPKEGADPNSLLACEARPFHKAGRNVLRNDCRSDTLPEDKFQQELAQPQNAHFATEFRKAGGR